eukprot:TRINITY_DN15242_c0_g1_i1.p1 TRINITY_DN15242_c0_g1~~TRINITY_DN15242_c0_g1_i1.p1  ORF type:complete len:1415 (-),score=323.12 TRINITY_DN15242_c0_g1_i1:37-3777(-)
MIREHCERLVTIKLWDTVKEGLREEVYESWPKLRKIRQSLEAPTKKRPSDELMNSGYDKTFLPSLIEDYFTILDTITADHCPTTHVQYCCRFLEFVIDLISQLSTRRIVHLLLEDSHFLVRSRRSALASLESKASLYKQLLNNLRFYQGFEINNFTGKALTDDDMSKEHYAKLKKLQHVAFKNFQPELKRFALSSVGSIDTREQLKTHLNSLKDDKLRSLCESIHLIDKRCQYTRDFLIELVISHHQRRLSQFQILNSQPLYPNEEVLWDEHQIPSDGPRKIKRGKAALPEDEEEAQKPVGEEDITDDITVALPKLNLQFLTIHDYLLRNFVLFRLESSYEIRQNIEDVVRRVKPTPTTRGTEFRGWARMAIPIDNFKITHVLPPKLGHVIPASVSAEVTFTLPARKTQSMNLREEWDELREHDILFLVSITAPNLSEAELKLQAAKKTKFPEKFGITAIRGCEVNLLADEEGGILSDPNPEKRPKYKVGQKRVLKVWLDPAQYQLDKDRKDKKKDTNAPTEEDSKTEGDGTDVYSTFNLLVRRRSKENNFKAVLETVRDLMNQEELKVPSWLKNVFLGYGDPRKCQNVSTTSEITFNDTFVSLDHVKASFPGKTIVLPSLPESEIVPPFRLKFSKNEVHVTPYTLPNMGPYPQDIPKTNSVPFTPVQIDCIKTAMNEGLSLVVGPPGTGKTDVAVQIVSNWYHNFPNQHTLIVTHSNQALNQIFEKIMRLDIDERHLLRLGHGERELDTNSDFSKLGRVDWMLNLRIEMLKQAAELAKSLGISEDVAYTCETAENFFTYEVLARWEKFTTDIEAARKKLRSEETGEDLEEREAKIISDHFPFALFFSNVQPLFAGGSYSSDLEVAEGCFRHVSRIFDQLKDCRAFELLRSSYDRGNYLLMKQAKIIAMTCTHAALKRKELYDLGFKFDNILMEESAQILEIETFIPMVLQNQDPEAPPRLKRIVLIGDHNQLPPVVKNMSILKYSHLDQSLFTRFVKLGVPTVQLDLQGRTRPSIAQLYNWRYPNLGNLPHVLNSPEYSFANPGFLYDYQMIDVADLNGVGESTPSPFFYQNLAEAEFVVATYIYMRMLGYPADRITILTSYNGQKHLLRDVIERRCPPSSGFGRPKKITTVDRYQGQQNDYVLLSLVRTNTVGHIRDVRRLVVAMSRARLGLYVFCRKSLFAHCHELKNTLKFFKERSDKLQLVQNDAYKSPDQPCLRKLDDKVTAFEVQGLQHMVNLTHNQKL